MLGRGFYVYFFSIHRFFVPRSTVLQFKESTKTSIDDRAILKMLKMFGRGVRSTFKTLGPSVNLPRAIKAAVFLIQALRRICGVQGTLSLSSWNCGAADDHSFAGSFFGYYLLICSRLVLLLIWLSVYPGPINEWSLNCFFIPDTFFRRWYFYFLIVSVKRANAVNKWFTRSDASFSSFFFHTLDSFPWERFEQILVRDRLVVVGPTTLTMQSRSGIFSEIDPAW